MSKFYTYEHIVSSNQVVITRYICTFSVILYLRFYRTYKNKYFYSLLCLFKQCILFILEHVYIFVEKIYVSTSIRKLYVILSVINIVYLGHKY